MFGYADGIRATTTHRSYLERYHEGDNTLFEQHDSIVAALEASQAQSESGNAGDASAVDDSLDQPLGVYAAEDVVEGGIKSGLYFSGLLNVDKYHQAEATVSVGDATSSSDTKTDGRISEILILGDTPRNHAVHGDQVAVELLPREQWHARTNTLKVANTTDTTSVATPASPAAAVAHATVPTGRVIRVIQRNWRTYAATLQVGEADKHGGKMVLAIPMVLVVVFV